MRVAHSIRTTYKPVALEFSIELEFRNVDFCGGRKTGETREKPSEQPTTNSTHYCLTCFLFDSICFFYHLRKNKGFLKIKHMYVLISVTFSYLPFILEIASHLVCQQTLYFVIEFIARKTLSAGDRDELKTQAGGREK